VRRRAARHGITALIDGLAVQMTVHDGVIAKRQVNTWVRAAAAELGVAPATQTLASASSDQPRDRVAGGQRRPVGRERGDVTSRRTNGGQVGEDRPIVGANWNA
jgi:hypothetical protein